MLIHLAIPGFHAAVHQAETPRTRGRPLAVALALHDSSPLFAVSPEARHAGIHAGMRVGDAQRRCRSLRVVLADPILYRRAQRAVATTCAVYTPCVGGRDGGFDLDLHGTEAIWRQRLRPGSAVDDQLEQGVLIARALTTACTQELHLPAFAGIATHVNAARLAARLAREPAHARSRVVGITPELRELVLDPLPLAWVPDCRSAASTLAIYGLTTIGDARALGAAELGRLLGDDATQVLTAFEEDEESVLPHLADPEPGVTVSRHCGAGGANPERAEAVLASLGRELGFALHRRALACAVVTLEGRWIDGRGTASMHQARRQLRHDDALAAVAQELCGRRERRVNWERFSLTASVLCAAEEQLELFAPMRALQFEEPGEMLRQAV